MQLTKAADIGSSFTPWPKTVAVAGPEKGRSAANAPRTTGLCATPSAQLTWLSSARGASRRISDGMRSQAASATKRPNATATGGWLMARSPRGGVRGGCWIGCGKAGPPDFW
jgi:hypothetical protein